MSDPLNGHPIPWDLLLEVNNQVYSEHYPGLLETPSSPSQAAAYVEFLKYTGDDERGKPMMTFSEIEHKLEDGAAEIKEHASHIFHSGVIDFASDVKTIEATAKADALVAVKDATPEVQAAVQAALETVEKAILAAIEARLA